MKKKTLPDLRTLKIPIQPRIYKKIRQISSF